jgi:hypothetical protein
MVFENRVLMRMFENRVLMRMFENIVLMRIFENRVLMRMFGPDKKEVTGGWKKLHNEKLNIFYIFTNYC